MSSGLKDAVEVSGKYTVELPTEETLKPIRPRQWASIKKRVQELSPATDWWQNALWTMVGAEISIFAGIFQVDNDKRSIWIALTLVGAAFLIVLWLAKRTGGRRVIEVRDRIIESMEDVEATWRNIE